MLKKLLAFTCCLTLSIGATAATIDLEGDTVIGVRGLMVDNKIYNVVFKKGSLSSLSGAGVEFIFMGKQQGAINFVDELNSVLSPDTPWVGSESATCTISPSCKSREYRVPHQDRLPTFFDATVGIFSYNEWTRESAYSSDPGFTWVFAIASEVIPADADGDGIPDTDDNCPNDPNADQLNTDGANDGGNACDDNDDADSWEDYYDNCPLVVNENQADFNGDGVGDACDIDKDGVPNDIDNCVWNANPDQVDSDGNGKGDVCNSTPLGC